MKKLFSLILFSCAMLIFIGCKSDKDKAVETIDAYMFKNLYDYKSYEVIETSLDSVNADGMTAFFAKSVVEDLCDKYKEIDEDASLQSWDKSYNKSEVFEMALNTVYNMLNNAECANNSTEHYYIANQRYRCKNAGGIGQIENREFLLNENLDTILFNHIVTDDPQFVTLGDSIVSIISEAMANEEKAKTYIKEYMKENPDAKTTSSGLVYRVIKEGNGKKPHLSSSIKVHYEGTYIDGQIFDSSYKRNKPIELYLNQVIEGWKEGIRLMPEKSVYEFLIPSKLAYGIKGNGIVPPNSLVIFKVELLKVY